MKKILITGGAGFIGFHLIKEIVNLDYEIVSLDCINSYYDINLKYGRLLDLGIDREKIIYNLEVKSNKYSNLSFIQMQLEDKENLKNLFDEKNFDYVINLAAQAGVRFSLKDPYSYINSNILGFLNILEACRYHNIKHLIYASSSSVYGLNKKVPFNENDVVDYPASLYAATKKSNELMAHTYSHLYDIPTTGLRFFTVYGEWGRPDMAYYKFVDKIYDNKSIDIYNHGKMKRDFTYVGDIVACISKLIEIIPEEINREDTRSKAKFKVYNIGNNNPVELLKFVEIIEDTVGKKAEKNFLPMQPGDVVETYADISELEHLIGFSPKTNLRNGIEKFINWYKDYYKIEE